MPFPNSVRRPRDPTRPRRRLFMNQTAKRPNTAKIVVVSQHYPPDQSTTAAIMAAIAGHLVALAPVLVVSGTPGSALHETTGQDRPVVVEIKNRIPAKAALIRRATAESLFTLRVFVALLSQLRRGDVALTVPAP